MHSELEDQIPFYALDGLSAEDSARLDEHLGVCPACRALLSEYQFVAGELLEQVPAQTAPAHLSIRLQNVAQADVKKTRSGVPNHAADPDNKVPFWQGQLGFPRWSAALALLAILVLLGISGALAWQLQQRDLRLTQVMQLLDARNLQFVEMTSVGTITTNNGFLCANSENPTGLLWLYGLEPLDHDHVYQVWLRANGTRDSGGTFRANYDGRVVTLINAPRPLGDYTEIGVTIEPVPGSAGPTTPRVVGGKLD